MLAYDVEATGLDYKHGALPYIISLCDEDGDQTCFEWPVNPLTRVPAIDLDDVAQLRAMLEAHDWRVCWHNGKYDAHLSVAAGIISNEEALLMLDRCDDTHMMGHLLGTNLTHNLTDEIVRYLGHLGIDIEPLELRVKAATQRARQLAKEQFPDWKLAQEGMEDMPSVKGSSKRDEDKPWKNDMWLPRALYAAYQHLGLEFDDSDTLDWPDVTRKYGMGDTEVLLPLRRVMLAEIERRGLTKIYRERIKLLRPYYGMEHHGVTVIEANTEDKIKGYGQYVENAEARLIGIAADMGYSLELAEGASINDNMRGFFYGSVVESCPRCKYVKQVKHWTGKQPDDNHDPFNGVCPKCAGRKRGPMKHKLNVVRNPCLSLPVVYGKKRGSGPSLDKDTMEHYQKTLDDGPALDFITTLVNKRARDTSLQFLHSYKRFWVPTPYPGFKQLHPSLNPCGTDHLRTASYNPNGQNISKKESECEECDGMGCEECKFTGIAMGSIRHCFGPAPDRVWYSMDLQSIERRIPAYESKEPKMVEVFERPDEPPYWGSLYLLTASVLYPDDYWPLAPEKGAFRKQHPRLYKQSKFFDLAKQYGCGRKKGDALSRVHGSFDLVDQNFPLLAKLQQHYLSFANKYGYVETIPDRKVDPDHGYPILASRTDDGRVLSTTPFNYHVSGTACWVKNAALIECRGQIDEWNRDEWDGFIALEIHDEILFDMPLDGTEDERALVLKGLMESCGDRIGMPTPCTAERHDQTWAEGVTVA